MTGLKSPPLKRADVAQMAEMAVATYLAAPEGLWRHRYSDGRQRDPYSIWELRHALRRYCICKLLGLKYVIIGNNGNNG